MSRTPAEYPGTRLKGREIRLLELMPGKAASPIRCRLTVHDLDVSDGNLPLDRNRAHYEALSYTWSGSSTCTVVLNGNVKFPVTDNLFYALKRLRQRHESRTLWIDALCINQKDVAERNQQVLLMQKIYTQAERVIVWLGDPYENGHTDDPAQLDIEQEARSMMALLEHQRPLWWERLWIVQELVLAYAEPEVYLGDWKMAWSDLRTLLSQVVAVWSADAFHHNDHREDLQKSIATAISAIDNLNVLRNDFRKVAANLCTAALYSSRALSGYGHDKVYGLLGLITERERQALKVDYAAKLSDVFSLATVAHITAMNSLDCLFIVPLLRGERKDLPTWTIDFDSRAKVDYDETLVYYLQGPDARQTRPRQSSSWRHHAWSHNAEAHCAKVLPSTDHDLLTVQGALFDFVAESTHSPAGSGQLESFIGKAERMLRSIRVNPYARHQGISGPRRQCSQPGDCICTLKDVDHFRLDMLADVLRNETKEPWQNAFEEDDSDIYNGAKSAAISFLSIIFRHWIRCVHGEDEAVFRREPIFTAHIHSELFTKEPTLFITENGFVGGGVQDVQRGDCVVLLPGCEWPAILRPDEHGSYAFQCLAYVQGIMDQELDEPCFRTPEMSTWNIR